MEKVVSNVVRLDRTPPPEPTLDRLCALTAGDMERVNHAIRTALEEVTLAEMAVPHLAFLCTPESLPIEPAKQKVI